MAAKRLNMAVLTVLAVAVLLVQGSLAQTTYDVGDGLGWTIPSVAYTTWAANKTFTIGDILVFKFTTGNHDVARVTKAAFDACRSTSPISSETNGPVNITLNDAGDHYYICTVGRHCTNGQKLAINVTAGAGADSSPLPSTAAGAPPSTTTSPPPPPPPPSTSVPASPQSAASSLGVSVLSATFLSFVIALLY